MVSKILSVKAKCLTDTPINAGFIPFLLLFSYTSLWLTFHCITGILFTYHPLLYSNHSIWIESILPFLQLLVSCFYLKYIFQSSHCSPDISCPFATLVSLIQSILPSWFTSPIPYSRTIFVIMWAVPVHFFISLWINFHRLYPLLHNF